MTVATDASLLKGSVVLPGMTCATARDRVAEVLRAGGVIDAAVAARVFVEDATDFGSTAFVGRSGEAVGAAAAETLGRWVERRLAGEPVFRIVGRREFWGLSFHITPDVLDPRPDSETLVEAALAALGPRRQTALRLCDLGIGSGALLAALLSECPHAAGWGVDRSGAAARMARDNLDAVGLSGRAVVVQASWGDAFAGQSFDLVVSNPPYIPSAVIPSLDREVRDHDPLMALDGGADGLACYRALLPVLPSLLAPGGLAVIESGAGQAADVVALGEAAGLTLVEKRRDLGSHERAVVFSRDP